MRSKIAGTAAMMVGFSTEVSPFVPFFILLELSVMVNDELYPIAQPAVIAMVCETLFELIIS